MAEFHRRRLAVSQPLTDARAPALPNVHVLLILVILLLLLLNLTLPTTITPVPSTHFHAFRPHPPHNYSISARITIGIKTYACDPTSRRLIETLLHTIRALYPDVTVLLGNDGPLALSNYPFIRHDPNTKELRLPLDAGISAGRNAMVAHATTPLFLLLDDDHLLDPSTDLSMLDVPGFDIIGLRVRNLPGIAELENGRIFLPRYIANVTRFENRTVELCVWDEQVGPGVMNMRVPLRVDVLHNAFVARRSVMLAHPWRNELKVNEHMTFFLDARAAKLRVGYLPSVFVHHRPRESSACYESVRRREESYERLLDYRDDFGWTPDCYKQFPKYVQWHLNVTAASSAASASAAGAAAAAS